MWVCWGATSPCGAREAIQTNLVLNDTVGNVQLHIYI